ncbi:MAG: Flp pilus assembly complex ATPase component TadA [Acidobacteria bacterium]|nr:Flp pilus assembly complex ATPase component TadA [Acidobacteriota bacterium]
MDRPLRAVLERAGVLPPEALAQAAADAQASRVPLLDHLVVSGHLSEETLADTLSDALKLPRLHLANVVADTDALMKVGDRLARRHGVLPLRIESGILVMAMANPTALPAIQDVEFASNLKVKPVVATRTEIADGIRQYYAAEDTLREFVSNIADVHDFTIIRNTQPEADPATPVAAAENTPVVKLCSVMLYDAIKTGTSDVHVEPALNEVKIRMRRDGVLRPYTTFPKWLHDAVVSRIKILAQLDIAERRLPQDGRIKIAYRSESVDVRVSTLPTHFGEKVVMRLLGGGRAPRLEAIGLRDEQRAFIENAIGQPQGLVIVTGPTGSGKTTTLYAMLAARQSPQVNIVTIEDPIEYQLPNVTQVQVHTKAGLTFASALRSILRQDPDIILLGEVRDAETAGIAFHAAATGHLVLTTLHTNSSTAAIGRLFDLGIEPLLITSSVNAIVAQRLLRRICESCKTADVPAADVLDKLKLSPSSGPYYQGRGCAQCGHTGYIGRFGVYELLAMTPRFRELVHQRASDADLRRAAATDGTQFLMTQAVAAVRAGITSVTEVLRVVQIEAEEKMRCPQCKAFLEEDFATCPYCLFRLGHSCPSCGQELKPDWKGCPYCHEKAPGDQIAVRDAPYALAAAISGAPAVKTPRILIVDDDPVMQLAIQGALSGMETRVELRTASDGEEALETIARDVPDAVILDVKMPRRDGFSVCEALRRDVRTAFVPILMLTSAGDEEHRTRGYIVGTDDYMLKPFSAKELNARVGRLLRRTYGV